MTAAQFSAPGVPLSPTRTPDKVLIVGGTGHVGRVFLEQGLENGLGRKADFGLLGIVRMHGISGLEST